MIPSPNCYALVRKSEGLVLHPYYDQARIPTIGYGTTRYPSGKHVEISDPYISESQAEDYMEHDLISAASATSNMLAGLNINQNQFDSLVDFTYNLGTGALHSSTLYKLIKINTLDPSIRIAFGLWNKITIDGSHVVSSDLVARRKAEADLYFRPVS